MADRAPDAHDTPTPDARLVSVFRTSDPGLLPLATMALDEAGIEYLLRHAGKGDSFEWMMSQPPTNRPIDQEILVASDVADEARALLGDLREAAPPDVL